MNRALFGLAVAVALAPPPALAQELTGTLKKIKDGGAVAIGYRESSLPFSYLNAGGRPIGYSIDLCLEIVDDAKDVLGIDEVKVDYVPVTPENRIDMVASGKVDLECGSTTSNLERQKRVAFSPVIFVSGTKLMVRRPVTIRSYLDLKGKTVAVTAGTTNQKAMQILSDKRKLGMRFEVAKDHAQSFSLLEKGGVDAFATDDVLLYGLIAKSGRAKDFQVVGDFLSYEPYGIMYRKGDPEFDAVVKGAFERLATSRELEQNYNKWFLRKLPDGERLNLPMSAQLRSIFEILGLPQ
ncbi:MAG TPA: amino acid ABC transporter substrate-binding protein [Burkholderiales bacterium]|nr:amino acid ABC transporter substrate-binding protein [Burkholderiales bacterium]